MNTNHKHHRKPGLYLWLETGAFFFFSAALCSLTVLGALGVDPFASTNAQSTSSVEAKR